MICCLWICMWKGVWPACGRPWAALVGFRAVEIACLSSPEPSSYRFGSLHLQNPEIDPTFSKLKFNKKHPLFLLLLCSRRATLVTNTGELNSVSLHNCCIQQQTNVLVIRGKNKHHVWPWTWNCITAAKCHSILPYVCFPFHISFLFLLNLHLPARIIAH